MEVVLGSPTIKAFVASPKEFTVLGIVRMGKRKCACMEYGLLATTASGEYVRVNGSVVVPLCRYAVESAIREACNHGRGESFAQTRRHAFIPIPKVIVTLRKHRHVALPKSYHTS